MRLGLLGETRRVWAPRGVKVVQEVQYSYKWTYLNLAVNGLTGKLHWSWMDNMKGNSIAPVVKDWADEGVEVIVWDGAKGHHGDAYNGVEVKRLQQPPYSPELNPAERVFEALRDKVEGVVYGTLAKKKRAVEAELQKLAAFPERVKRLAGWPWIRKAMASLEEKIMASH